MKTDAQIQQELTNYRWQQNTPLSQKARAWLINDIEIQQAVEPETERRDFSHKDISDSQLFLLWLRA